MVALSPKVKVTANLGQDDSRPFLYGGVDYASKEIKEVDGSD